MEKRKMVSKRNLKIPQLSLVLVLKSKMAYPAYKYKLLV